jgi:hypothetical protein
MRYGQAMKYTFVSGGTLTQFVPVTVAGVLSIAPLTAYGVNQTKPNTGDHATAVVVGETKALVGSGGLAVGDLVTVAASGFTKALSGSQPIGRCIFAANSGGLADIFFSSVPGYIAS